MPSEQNDLCEQLRAIWSKEAQLADKIADWSDVARTFDGAENEFVDHLEILKHLQSQLDELTRESQKLVRSLEGGVGQLPDELHHSYGKKAESVNRALRAVQTCGTDLRKMKSQVLESIAKSNVHHRMLSAYEQ